MKNTRKFPEIRSRLLCSIVLAVIAGFLFAACEVSKGKIEPRRPGLPSLHLSIAPYERGGLDRWEWRPSTVSLRGGANTPAEHTFEGIRIEARGRGNTSWNNSNKRPLRIRFDTARTMFGSDYRALNWTLIANALEHSMVRNYSAYLLGELLDGLDFSPARHFVHLYMDGEYRGVYMLSDQMNINDGRMLLTAGNVPDLSEYFLEWCFRASDENEPYAYFVIGSMSFFRSNGRVEGVPFGIRFPGGSILRRNLGHREFAKNFIMRVDDTLARGDFYEIAQVIDVPSFIDFYLVQELFKNQDVGVSSLFFQIRRVGARHKLFAGPLWDFDRSIGSSDWGSTSPQGAWAATQNQFFRHLMNTNQFRGKVAARWSEIRNDEVQTMIREIRDLTTAYRACFERNFRRWPNKNTHGIPMELRRLPFPGQVDFLIDWLEQRKAWMDGFLL